MDGSDADDRRGDGSGAGDGDAEADPTVAPPSAVEAGGDDWAAERTAETRAALDVGDELRFEKRLSAADVEAFARASGDTNRLHLDEGFAERTRFGGRIAHGALVAGAVSAALARLPGVVVFLSQELSFVAPAPVGSRVVAVCEVVEALGGDRYRLAVSARADGETAVEGEAEVMLDESPADG